MSLWIIKRFHCPSSCFFFLFLFVFDNRSFKLSPVRGADKVSKLYPGPCSQSSINSLIDPVRISDLWSQSSTNTILNKRKIPKVNLGYLPFTWKNRKIRFNKRGFIFSRFRQSNGSHHSVWEASENMGCDIRWCNISTLFSLYRWFWYAL